MGRRCARSRGWVLGGAAVVVAAGVGVAALVPTTLEDFHLSGTQIGDVPINMIGDSSGCVGCHSHYNDEDNEPYRPWKGSLMGVAGRDPLFFAQMATANQDVNGVGYFCMRCHVPMSYVTGTASDPSGESLTQTDLDGVSCHFCHSMVDPIYKEGVSPPEDVGVLAGLAETPEYYGNAMFVLDPLGRRRGPYSDPAAPHVAIPSAFHETGAFCGTCHDVGNIAVAKQANGTYRYNMIDMATPDENPATQFPLERTYTEWKLSSFANGGVDMGGRFGGAGPTTVSTCQDCHMPQATGQGAAGGPVRTDLARHDFAGASAWVLDIIAKHYADDPAVDVAALADGRDKAISMLQRAASLEVAQIGGAIKVRVINETGHKLPTGHIEGRRVWIGVKIYGAGDVLVKEYGHYDFDEAHLDEESTTIFEMHVGLSEDAASATGLPVGLTGHMALADTIEKDNRIPPRGFANAAYEAAGAPVVGAQYSDGQHWADVYYQLPPGAGRAEVTVNYQTVTRHYIEALRDGNTTNHWGNTLHDLWEQTNKGAPIPMAINDFSLAPFVYGDLNSDGIVNAFDLALLLGAWAQTNNPADLSSNGIVRAEDLALLLGAWGSSK